MFVRLPIGKIRIQTVDLVDKKLRYERIIKSKVYRNAMVRVRGILVRRLEEKLYNSLEGSFLVLEIQIFDKLSLLMFYNC